MAWRERGAPVWKELRPVAIVGLAATVLVLGTIGFQDYQRIHHGTHYSVLDALYRSLQLFGFGGNLDPRVPVTLQIARLLGPVLAGYALIRGILVLSRDQIQLMLFRLFLRNHVIVVGLGTAGFRIATAFQDQGYRVVAIERDASSAAIRGCRERGIGVVVGEAADESILRTIRIDRASCLAVTCGDDRRNIDVAAAASDAMRDRRRGVLTALVHLDDFGLLGMMKAQSLTSISNSSFRLAIFNVFDTAAALLFEAHPPIPARPTRGVFRVLVFGFDGVGPTLVLSALQKWQSSERDPMARLVITLVGPDAENQRRDLLLREPDIDSVPMAALEAWNVSFDSAEFQRESLMGATALYVCLENEAEALAIALKLACRSDIGDARVVVVLPDDSTGVATALKGQGPLLERIVPFGIFTRAFEPEAFAHTTNESLARASHETHRDTQRAEGLTEAEDPSLVPWEELPEALRESNRLFADSIPAKLGEIGYVVEPAPLADHRSPPTELSDEHVELLAPMEHDRWSEDMQRHLGYRKTSGEKDARRRLHPLIGVPFEELPKENQDKDREKVRSISKIIARAGFRIVPSAGVQPDATTDTQAGEIVVGLEVRGP
jgi:voltage-gated potassium channel Kch